MLRSTEMLLMVQHAVKRGSWNLLVPCVQCVVYFLFLVCEGSGNNCGLRTAIRLFVFRVNG